MDWVVHIRHTKLLAQCFLSPEEFELRWSVNCLTLCTLRNPPEASVTLRHHQRISEFPKTHRSLSSGEERLILSPPCLLHGLFDYQLCLDATLWHGLLHSKPLLYITFWMQKYFFFLCWFCTLENWIWFQTLSMRLESQISFNIWDIR